MNKYISPLLLAVSMVAAAYPALAQETHKGKGMNMPTFAQFDLNGDGKISEEEYYKARAARIAQRAKDGHKMKNLANAPAFADIDTDSNASVSPSEFAAHQAEHRASEKN